MDTHAHTPAPRWREGAAGLVDVALGAAVLRLLRSRSPSLAGARWASLLAPSRELVREQLASPGQRLLGLRTVDRRTGRRVAPWRTLLLAGAAAAGSVLVERLRPAPDAEAERLRAAFSEEVREIARRHAADPAARNEAIMRHWQASHPPPRAADPVRLIAPGLALALVNRWLRRRLAPTEEILVRRPESHSP